MKGYMDENFDYTGRDWHTGEPHIPRHRETLSCGNFKPGTQYLLPNLLSGSDYSGGTVERSNYEVFLKKYGRRKGVHRLSGGMGTFGIAVKLPLPEDIEEDLYGLQDYPILNEEHHSHLEWKLIEQEWEGLKSHVENDILQELEGIVSEDLEELEDLEVLFERAREDTNTEWIFETGCAVFIDPSLIIPYLVEFYKARYGLPDQLPLLLGQLTWDRAQKELETRFKGAVTHEVQT